MRSYYFLEGAGNGSTTTPNSPDASKESEKSKSKTKNTDGSAGTFTENDVEWTTLNYMADDSSVNDTGSGDDNAAPKMEWDLLQSIRSDGWQLIDKDHMSQEIKSLHQCEFGGHSCNTSVSSSLNELKYIVAV